MQTKTISFELLKSLFTKIRSFVYKNSIVCLQKLPRSD